MSDSTASSLLLVLGMHRSGTSALTGVLHDCGARIATNLIADQPEINRQGFWEDREVVEINDAVLEGCGLRWFDWRAVPQQTMQGLAAGPVGMRACTHLETQYSNQAVSVCKDPRFSRTLPFWQACLSKTDLHCHFLLCVRHPSEVAASLRARDGLPLEYGHLLWLVYNLDALRALDAESAQRVSYADLFDAPLGTLQNLIDQTGLNHLLAVDQAAIAKRVDSTLRHHQTNDEALALPALQDATSELYNALLNTHRPKWGAACDNATTLLHGNATTWRLLGSLANESMAASVRLVDIGDRHSQALEVIMRKDQEISNLAAEHEHAQATVRERDEQLRKEIAWREQLERELKKHMAASKEIVKIGRLHSQALEVIEQRDREISGLTAEHEHAEAVVRERDEQLVKEIAWREHLERELVNHQEQIDEIGIELNRARLEIADARSRQSEAMVATPLIDVVVPVYRDFVQTRRCIESVLGSSCQTPYELVLVWDCGPDEALLQYLRTVQERPRVILLENPDNLGFVASVNHGMQLHDERDVLILNSDTEVANDWLDRIVATANSDPCIATVTPFSNNAEICSFPTLCASNTLPVGFDTAAVDRVFSDSVDAAAIDIPTGVGFCMLIRRSAINALGGFDELLFQRGYGEENDFCRRADAAGMRNVLTTNVYVYHEGAVSFGAERQQLVDNAMRVLDRKFPDYHRLVHRHIANDPALAYRVQAGLGLLKARGLPIVLVITHNLGGGTDRYVDELQRSQQGKVQFLQVRPREHYLLEISLPQDSLQLYFDIRVQREALIEFCHAIGVARIHVQHLMGLEATMLDLLRELSLPYDLTLHDYYLINGDPTLTDEDGSFCADPMSRDANCARRYPVPIGKTADDWREISGQLLRGAERVIAASHYVADLYAHYFPGLEFTFAWHPDFEAEAPYPAPRLPQETEPKRWRVVVIGALSLEKGALVMERVAIEARKLSCPLEFHMLGYAFRPLHDAVITHGPYAEEELDAKLKDIDAHCVWFPCQWPETYSYTLSASLRNALPIIAPDFGAFSERLHGRALTRLVAATVRTEDWLAELQHFVSALWVRQERPIAQSTCSGAGSWPDQRRIDFYASGYSDPIHAVRPVTLPQLDYIRRQLAPRGSLRQEHGWRERFLLLLFHLRTLPVLRTFSRIIPESLQRALKRRLSSRPVHEIAKRE